MDAFWRLASGGSSIEEFAKDVYIKSNLTSQINSSLKKLQREYADCYVGSGQNVNIFTEMSSPAVQELCNCLEAVLLHGLKGKLSFAHVLGAASMDGKGNRMKELDFWPIVLILCHNQVSECLKRLRNVDTDVGRCRAWLRLALNENLLSSYIEVLSSDTSLLHGFYKSSAYLRDTDHMELLRSFFLDGLDSLIFQLNYDSGYLNCWNEDTLKLIGMIVPEIPEPVMAAVDAVELIRNEERKTRKNLVVMNQNKLADNQVLKKSDKLKDKKNDIEKTKETSGTLIETTEQKTEVSLEESPQQDLAKLENETLTNQILPSNQPLIQIDRPADTTNNTELTQSSSSLVTSAIVDNTSVGGNSINRIVGWSTTPPQTIVRSTREEDVPFDALLQSYSTQAMLSSTPDMRDIGFDLSIAPDDRLGNELREPKKRSFSLFSKKSIKNSIENTSDSFSASFDFEVIPKSVILKNDDPDTQIFLNQLPSLCQILGLDEQDYKCNSCGRPIGMIYGKSRLCLFDGYNYCLDCHKNSEIIIPAKVLQNWDFKKYQVCERNKNMLEKTETEPLLDIKLNSPALYQNINELKECLTLRNQLFYLHAYLFTCQESVAFELRKQFWPREHLFEHIHLYSLADLIQVQSGAMMVALKRCIQWAKNHVLKCSLCSQKGFICEFCKSSEIIYPFDTQKTHLCDTCKAVFHLNCIKTKSGELVPCPRCLRIQKRERANTTI